MWNELFYFLQGKLYSSIQGESCDICISSIWFFNILTACCLASVPYCRVKLDSVLESLKMPGSADQYLAADKFNASGRTPAASRRYTACVALRTTNANAEPYLHVLTCTLSANVQHFHNQRWLVLHGSASKYDNSVRWSQRGRDACEKGTEGEDRHYCLPSIYPSHLCLFDSPVCHFLPLSLMVLLLPVVLSYI